MSTSIAAHACGISRTLRAMRSAIIVRIGDGRVNWSPGGGRSASSVASVASSECWVGSCSRYRSTSRFVTRPPCPEPDNCAKSIAWRCASRNTTGEYTAFRPLAPPEALRAREGSSLAACSPVASPVSKEVSRNSPPVGPTFAPVTMVPIRPARSSCCWAETGASTADCVAPSSTSISAITEPIAMVAPSSAINFVTVPSAVAVTSMFTLSVTTSTSGSYFRTTSPGATSHFPMIASVTDSPTCGISTSKAAICQALARSRIAVAMSSTPGRYSASWFGLNGIGGISGGVNLDTGASRL